MSIINKTFKPAAEECLHRAQERLGEIQNKIAAVAAFNSFFFELARLNEEANKGELVDGSSDNEKYESMTGDPASFIINSQPFFTYKLFGDPALPTQGAVRLVSAHDLAVCLQTVMHTTLSNKDAFSVHGVRLCSKVYGAAADTLMASYFKAVAEMTEEMRDVNMIASQFSFVNIYKTIVAPATPGIGDPPFDIRFVLGTLKSTDVPRAMEAYITDSRRVLRDASAMMHMTVPGSSISRSVITAEDLAKKVQTGELDNVKVTQDFDASKLISAVFTRINTTMNLAQEQLDKKPRLSVANAFQHLKNYASLLLQYMPAPALLSHHIVQSHEAERGNGAGFYVYYTLEHRTPESHLANFLGEIALSYAVLGLCAANKETPSNSMMRDIAEQIKRCFCENHAQFVEGFTGVTERCNSIGMRPTNEIRTTSELITMACTTLNHIEKLVDTIASFSGTGVEGARVQIADYYSEAEALRNELKEQSYLVVSVPNFGDYDANYWLDQVDHPAPMAYNFSSEPKSRDTTKSRAAIQQTVPEVVSPVASTQGESILDILAEKPANA